MNLKKILTWLKYKRQKPISNKLDHKLIKKIRTNFLPKWSQFKYINRFLSKVERKIIKISFLIIVLTTTTWAVFFIFKNNTSVPAEGGEYIEALIGQPKFINPLFSSTNDVDANLTSLIFSGLFSYDNQQKLTPELVSKYTISKDKKNYDIELRKDIKWSDDESFNADDVIFTFEAIQNPAVNSPLLATFQGVKVERKGDHSIQFTLKEPFSPFLNSLTLKILPEHIWRNILPINMKLAKNNLQPIGNGMWKFSKLTKDQAGNLQTYTLVPNKNYYKKIPNLKTLIFKFYPDYTQAVAAIKSQDVMGLAFVPRDLKEKISTNNFNTHNFQLPQYTALFFNQEKEKNLEDGKLRQALLQAIDKNKLVQETLNSGAIKVDSPILKNSLGYDPSIKYPKYNLASSTDLLDKKWKKIQPEEYFQIQYEELIKNKQTEIDYIKENASSSPETASSSIEKIKKELKETIRKEMDSKQNFYWKDTNNNILKLTITTLNTGEFKQVAEKIIEMWRDAGVQASIDLVEKHQINDVLKNRDYQILLYGEIVGSDPDPYPFWHSSQINYPGLNLSMFSDRDADELLEKARSGVSDKERANLYKKFQKILVKEIPSIFLYTPDHNFIVHKQIKGIDIKGVLRPYDRYANINNWYIKTKKQWIRK